MKEDIIAFLTLSDPNARNVVLGAVILGTGAGMVGCFAFLRKRALIGDAVAHALLPGVCLAFLVSGTKNPLFLLLGAAISGWFALISMDFIARNTKLKLDTIIGLILSVFFGIGILLLTSIQRSGMANQAGLDKFLFGRAAAMSWEDVMTIGWVSMLIVVILVLFYQPFKLISFDPEFAHARGFPIKTLEFLLSTLTVLAVAIGIQAVGVVLMAALLITPAAAARFWTDRLLVMLILSGLFGVLSAWLGAFASALAPSTPTGPWIVIVLSVIAMLSVLFAPQKGMLARIKRQRRHQVKMLKENILKSFFLLAEIKKDGKDSRAISEFNEIRAFSKDELKKGLLMLKRAHLIEELPGNLWHLTPEGREASVRVVRLHRLWELYLNEKMNIAPDHVHHDAEAIEHILTPELEQQLEKELGYPVFDPHQSQIPY